MSAASSSALRKIVSPTWQRAPSGKLLPVLRSRGNVDRHERFSEAGISSEDRQFAQRDSLVPKPSDFFRAHALETLSSTSAAVSIDRWPWNPGCFEPTYWAIFWSSTSSSGGMHWRSFTVRSCARTISADNFRARNAPAMLSKV